MKTFQNLPDITGKRIIIRVDFNVPLDENGNVREDKRIQHALPTLRYLLEAGASQLVLMTHVGRPKNNEPNLKTDKIAAYLQSLLNIEVAKIDDWGEGGVPTSKIVMLENLRFNPAEKSKKESERDLFGKQLASLADFYVNEAFSNSHREHASMTSVPKFIPGFAGLGVEKEVNSIKKAIQNPEHPLVAIIGGLKADKLPAIDYLMNVADHILVAGALAFTLRKAQGVNVGSSKVDEEGMEELASLVEKITQSNKVLLPEDAVVADTFDEKANHKIVQIDQIEEGWMALDIGPKTIEKYSPYLQSAKTILWFGPIGVFEMEPFANGTRVIARAMAESPAITIIGGGDSAGAVSQLGLEEKMTLVSTGGGASLQMIEGKKLPAIEILK
ncbi:phosphoglycerate kinase [Candidatus Peregrinibacteria bacterium CG_4_10_14_0_2_um_filter_43_11]|nr:MAG: phosphoglycerate kinase [Candidatus Peregrinibacteria bacterium CG_4_10_14_0_2_um_filter_43_11]